MDDHYESRQHERIAALIELGLGHELSRRELIRRGMALGLGMPAVLAALAACGVDRPAGALSPWRPATPPAAPSPALAVPTAGPAPLTGSFTAAPTAASAASPAPTAAPQPTRFAIIGDYGMAGEPAAAVAALVAGWQPAFVATLGDNNYPDGAADTIDANIGQYYSAFIAPYRGGFGPGASESRFFPVLGNHDWVVGYPEPYLSYFSPPGNGRYYSFERGPMGFFMLDSMPGEPDGTSADSAQGQWLQAALAASAARWKLVLMHHPPFSSGHHGSSAWMQWPFAAWGAQLVLAGHDHSYERIVRDGITYIVNGLGGAARYAPGFAPEAGSQIFFNAEHGAMLAEADDAGLRVQFITRAGGLIDELRLS